MGKYLIQSISAEVVYKCIAVIVNKRENQCFPSHKVQMRDKAMIVLKVMEYLFLTRLDQKLVIRSIFAFQTLGV